MLHNNILSEKTPPFFVVLFSVFEEIILKFISATKAKSALESVYLLFRYDKSKFWHIK